MVRSVGRHKHRCIGGVCVLATTGYLRRSAPHSAAGEHNLLGDCNELGDITDTGSYGRGIRWTSNVVSSRSDFIPANY